jgi:NTP pyrophosphatase (non-canonical NTP hydrolase)
MRLHEYQKLAMRTAPEKTGEFIDARQLQLLHCVLGICGEVGEIVEDLENKENVIQEVGDVTWYMAIGLDAIGFDMENLETEVNYEGTYDDLVIQSAILADIVKRHVYYKTEFNFEKFITTMGMILSCLEGIALEYSFNIETALENNIKKLQIRYPYKFSTDKAINRDVAKELKAFK